MLKEWSIHIASVQKSGTWARLRLLAKAPLNARSSSREVRIRVPFFLQSILVGEPSQPKKGRERALLGDLEWLPTHVMEALEPPLIRPFRPNRHDFWWPLSFWVSSESCRFPLDAKVAKAPASGAFCVVFPPGFFQPELICNCCIN